MHPIAILLHTIGIIGCVLVTFIGVVGFINAVEFPPPLNFYTGPFDFVNWTQPFNMTFLEAQQSITICFLSILSAMGELRVKMVLHHFRFFKGFMGHGLFYVFLSLNTLGISGNLGILVGGTVFIIGLIQLLCSILCNSCVSSRNYETIQ